MACRPGKLIWIGHRVVPLSRELDSVPLANGRRPKYNVSDFQFSHRPLLAARCDYGRTYKETTSKHLSSASPTPSSSISASPVPSSSISSSTSSSLPSVTPSVSVTSVNDTANGTDLAAATPPPVPNYNDGTAMGFLFGTVGLVLSISFVVINI
ncbi:hypothetical protein BC937DRAFT_93494 [Endogone sp. FLAS-F59071]|nr:hypothetical protein BC937DRAFT_93494 [Endogone sp. FLAS-F59071]|eukprot:RUS14666.1 hypothetical protein BC937DRAFT_93494 [Endogone sp. FLAS-F59071]